MIKFEQVEDLLATAQQIELGAAERYRENAEAARTENPEIAALFQRLAEEEQQHEKDVIQLAEDASVDLSKSLVTKKTDPSRNTEKSDQIKDSLYEILAAAVKREEQAFEIYSQIAASSPNNDVRHYAEILAKEELGHAALLRAMRRRVYHEHKNQIKTTLLQGPDKINLKEDFLLNAYILEKAIVKYIDNIADTGIDMIISQEHTDSVIDQLVNEIKINNDQNFNKLDDVSEDMLSDTVAFTIDDLMTECEFAYEYYDSFVLNTEDEQIMNKALSLASETLTLLTLLQDIKNELGDKDK